MTEDKKRLHDVWLEGCKIGLTVLTVIIGICQFNSGQRTAKRKDFEREQWKQRLDNYNRVTEIAGILASDYTTDSVFITNRQELERVYWGTATMIQDTTVTNAMIEFRSAVKDYNLERKTQLDLDIIKTNAALLAEACKRSICNTQRIIEND